MYTIEIDEVNPSVRRADMARSAAELLLRRPREGRQGPPSTIVFRTQPVERGAVGPLSKAKAASSS